MLCLRVVVEGAKVSLGTRTVMCSGFEWVETEGSRSGCDHGHTSASLLTPLRIVAGREHRGLPASDGPAWGCQHRANKMTGSPAGAAKTTQRQRGDFSFLSFL